MRQRVYRGNWVVATGFVLLTEVGGRVDPRIGFPTAGFNGIPEFPLERHYIVDNNGDNTPAPVVPPAVNNPVTLSGLSVPGGELTVNEANLPDGSAANPAALIQTGSFTVSAPDGLSSLNIGGINVISGGVAVGFPQSITTQLGNTPDHHRLQREHRRGQLQLHPQWQ